MSTIRLGDEVRFLNENLAGIVTSINGNIAGVTIEDDFEIPVPLSQLVSVSQIQTKANESVALKPLNKESLINQCICIAFERLNEVLLDLKLHNSDAEEILFAYYEEKNGQILLKKSGRLLLNETIDLGRFDLNDFSTWPKIYFQIIRVKNNLDKILVPINQSMVFNAKEFHGAYKYTFFLSKQAYFFRLDDERITPLDIQKLQDRDFSEKQEVKISFDKKPEQIVDLHTEALFSKTTFPDPTEIISKQMEAFVKSLEMAHVHKMKSIVFIHGIGNHYLKNKIKNYLNLQKQIVSSYQDADILKYGGGATEVFLN